MVDAAETAISVSEAAERHRVTFERFDFSNMVLNYVLERTDAVSMCLDGLYAPDSVMWDVWGSYCTSYERADLRRCKFVSLYVDPTILPGANIFEAKFKEANLEGADLRLAYLRGSDFFRANLAGADLRNTVITSCRFTGAKGPFVTGNVNTKSWMMPR